MKNSEMMTKRSLSIWQFTLLISITYALGIVVSHYTTVTETIYWSGYELEQRSSEGNWVSSNRMRIGAQDTVQEVRFNVSIDDSEKWLRPIGLMVGGPFSAEVFWDENLIDNKGAVGDSSQSEIPGPIDSIAFVPPAMLKPGEHTIRLLISTQHLLLNDDSVFHYVWLTPYRESGRRDIRYYAAPLIILSALILLSVQSFRIGRSAGNAMHIGIGLFGFSIVVLLLSEVSRALINYPYHYHELRGMIGWLSNICAGLALMYTCAKTLSTRFAKTAVLAGVAILIISYFFPMNSGDERLALDFILLSLAPTLVFAVLLIRKQVSYLSTLPIFWLACVVSNQLSTGLFLDSFQFIAALVFIAGSWLWVYVDFSVNSSAQTDHQEGSKTFIVSSPGGNRTIAVSDCYALKGEGNYTNLLLINGETILHQDGIGAIMETKPVDFTRVHKSYAVNLNTVKKIRSAPGSKYWADMVNGESIPVSRYRASELRGLLNPTP